MLCLYQKSFVSLCKIKVRQGSCDELVAHSQNKTFACTQTDSLDERETIFVLHQILEFAFKLKAFLLKVVVVQHVPVGGDAVATG